MNPERFSIFLADLSAWSANPPPCADPAILDAPLESDEPDEASSAPAKPRGTESSARRAALNNKLKKRLAEAKAGGERETEVAEVPILDEDDDAYDLAPELGGY